MMKALGYFLLIPASVFLYFALMSGMGIFQRYPIAHFLIIAVALFFLAKLIREKFSVWRLLLNIGGWMLALLYGWWTLSYSNFPTLESPLTLEQQTNAFSIELPDSDEKTTSLAEIAKGKKGVAVVFYRGFW